MNNKQDQKAVYLMQSICLTNYCKLCSQLKLIPDMIVVKMITDCEDKGKLDETNQIILGQLK